MFFLAVPYTFSRAEITSAEDSHCCGGSRLPFLQILYNKRIDPRDAGIGRKQKQGEQE